MQYAGVAEDTPRIVIIAKSSKELKFGEICVQMLLRPAIHSVTEKGKKNG